MPPKKDKSIKIKVCILNASEKSQNYSIRLKDGVSITEGLKEIINQIEKR